MNVYELQRQENIRRNQSLLKELHLDSVITTTVKRARPDNDKAGTKRRKLETLPPPTRSSARLSAAPKPNYTDTPNSTPPQRSTGPQKRRTTAHDPTASPPPDADASEAPPADLEAITQGWHWHATAPPPTRDETTGALHFADFADFAPNKTPAEILREGCFGGCYFRPVRSRKLGVVVEGDWEELPEEWTRGLDVGRYLTGEKNEGRYDPEVNKYKVACGQSIEEWEAAGWIDHRFDPRGWFQWYIRFYQGRRCEDDARQVSRWKKCVGATGRWRRILLKKYVQMGIKEVFDYGDGDDEGAGRDVSPVVHQTCHHWAYEVRQDDLDRFWKTGT